MLKRRKGLARNGKVSKRRGTMSTSELLLTVTSRRRRSTSPTSRRK